MCDVEDPSTFGRRSHHFIWNGCGAKSPGAGHSSIRSSNSQRPEEPSQPECILLKIIGKFPNGCRPEAAIRNVNLPLLILQTIATCLVPDQLLFSCRIKAEGSKDIDSDQIPANAGYFQEKVHSESVYVYQCAFCTTTLAEAESYPAMMTKHSASCRYRDLMAAIHSSSRSASESENGAPLFKTRSDTVQKELQPLVLHLKTELVGTKAIVATEMGYSEDEICLAMSKQFIANGTGFPDAGSLVDVLLDEWTFFELSYPCIRNDLKGIAQFIKNVTIQEEKLDLLRVPSVRKPKVRQETTGASGGQPYHYPEFTREQANNISTSNLMEETRNLVYQSSCKACLGTDATILCLPCTHISLCDACGVQWEVCPHCFEPVESTIRVYM